MKKKEEEEGVEKRWGKESKKNRRNRSRRE